MTLTQQREYKSIIAFLTVRTNELDENHLINLLQIASDKDLVDALTEEITSRQQRLQDAIIEHTDDVPRTSTNDYDVVFQSIANIIRP